VLTWSVAVRLLFTRTPSIVILLTRSVVVPDARIFRESDAIGKQSHVTLNSSAVSCSWLPKSWHSRLHHHVYGSIRQELSDKCHQRTLRLHFRHDADAGQQN